MSSSIIKSDCVRIESTASEPAAALPTRAAAAGSPKAQARCQKRVQLLREADVVHAIEVRCSCGEVTVVELEYDPKQG
jgi:hypothetical protein